MHLFFIFVCERHRLQTHRWQSTCTMHAHTKCVTKCKGQNNGQNNIMVQHRKQWTNDWNKQEGKWIIAGKRKVRNDGIRTNLSSFIKNVNRSFMIKTDKKIVTCTAKQTSEERRKGNTTITKVPRPKNTSTRASILILNHSCCSDVKSFKYMLAYIFMHLRFIPIGLKLHVFAQTSNWAIKISTRNNMCSC